MHLNVGAPAKEAQVFDCLCVMLLLWASHCPLMVIQWYCSSIVNIPVSVHNMASSSLPLSPHDGNHHSVIDLQSLLIPRQCVSPPPLTGRTALLQGVSMAVAYCPMKSGCK